jgi:hypothetical protein
MTFVLAIGMCKKQTKYFGMGCWKLSADTKNCTQKFVHYKKITTDAFQATRCKNFVTLLFWNLLT